MGGEVEAVEEQSGAPGVDEGGAEGFKRHGDGLAEAAEIVEAYGGGSGPAGGWVAEVKLGMVVAKGLAAERGGVALPAGGHDVTTLDEPKHVHSPRGVSPHTLRLKTLL